MKITIVSVFLLILAVPKVEAVDKYKYTTAANAVFCMSLSDITKLKTFMAQGDKYATAKLFDNGDCAIVKPALEVFILQNNGDIVLVWREGMTESLWTFRGESEQQQGEQDFLLERKE